MVMEVVECPVFLFSSFCFPFTSGDLCDIIFTMGSCVSKPDRRIKAVRSPYLRPGKRRGRMSSSISDGVRDFAVSEFVHLDFEKGATTSCRKSVSNMKIHLTQLQWNHSQIDGNCRFQTYFNMEKRDHIAVPFF